MKFTSTVTSPNEYLRHYSGYKNTNSSTLSMFYLKHLQFSKVLTDLTVFLKEKIMNLKFT